MKIKITEAGNEAFTGWIGDVEFARGVSVNDQPEQAIAHVGAIYSIELIEVDAKEAEVKTPEKAVEKEADAPEAPEVPEVPEATVETAETEDVPAVDAVDTPVKE